MFTDLDTGVPSIKSIIFCNFDIAKSCELYYNEKNKKEFIEGAEELQQKYESLTKEQYEQHEEFKLVGERQAGIEQGTIQEKLDTVKKMLEKDYDITEIVDITSLDKEEIIKIKEDL